MTTTTRSIIQSAAGYRAYPDKYWDLTGVNTSVSPLNFVNTDRYDLLTGMAFNDDETKIYLLDDSTDKVYQHDLTTAGDIGTISETSTSFYFGGTITQARGLFFKPDGTEFYTVSYTTDTVYQFSLSTAWDITTASYTRSLSISATATIPQGIFFKSDGTLMFIADNGNDSVQRFSLSTAWDISTATFSQIVYVSTQTNNPCGPWFNSTGTIMFIADSNTTATNLMHRYYLPTPYDFGTVTYHSSSGNPQINNYGTTFLVFNSDGSKAYTCSPFLDMLMQLDFSTNYQLNTMSWSAPSTDWITTFNDASSLAGLNFSPTGEYMYATQWSLDLIHQWTLSTPWNVATATYNSYLDVTTEEAYNWDCFLSTDGSKLYSIGYGSDNVNEYDLSTNWDVTTGTYSQSFSVASQDATSTGMCFKPDGTKMYVVGSANDSVYEYDLSTAWDVSSASYSQTYSISAYQTSPFHIKFNPNGMQFFVMDAASAAAKVHQYNLSTAWDISSVVSHSEPIVAATDLWPVVALPRGLYIKHDGSKIWFVDSNSGLQRSITGFDL